MMGVAFGFKRGLIRVYEDELSGLRSMVRDERVRGERDAHTFAEHLMLMLSTHHPVLWWNDQRIDPCELHCWVDAADRVWLANMVVEGLECGVFRRTLRGTDLGWGSVIDLLTADARDPCVLSYSVTGWFPNENLGIPLFGALPESARFKRCWDALRDMGPVFRMQPYGFREFRFGTGISALDVMADDYVARLDKAYPRAK